MGQQQREHPRWAAWLRARGHCYLAELGQSCAMTQRNQAARCPGRVSSSRESIPLSGLGEGLEA